MTTMLTTPASNATSRAVVFTTPREPLRVTSLPLHDPGPGEVRVRVQCCTICGSDLHTYLGHRPTPAPLILGHEVLGLVDRVYEADRATDVNGDPLRVGDRVTWSIIAPCGQCFYCTRRLPQKCERLFKYGHQAISEHHPLSGGLAEHCMLARGTTIVRIPPHLPDAVACPANCATATVAAAIRTARVQPDQTMMIQGLGMLGLTAAAMARSLGVTRVIGCDTNAERLALASHFGVTHSIDVSQSTIALETTVNHVTAGRGVDVAMEMSGSPKAISAALPLLRAGGHYVLVGAVFPGPDVSFNPEMIVRRMLSIHGQHNYTSQDLVDAVKFLTDHGQVYPFEQLVRKDWRLHEAEAAFQFAASRRPTRIAIRP